MRTVRKFNLILLLALIFPVGCNADNGAARNESVKAKKEEKVEKGIVSYTELAKKIVEDYDLTSVPLECLTFENAGEADGFKVVVNVREIHNESCKGDTQVSPRLFSIAFDKNDKVWSDAKSLLGQLERLD
jgi:hypothetical protein